MKSEQRKYKGLVRCHEFTHGRLKALATAKNLTMADLLEELVVTAERELTPTRCRYCEVALANPKDRGTGHAPSCPLAIR
jgi:hypothetical protein